MIDTHVHLNYDPLAADVAGVLTRAREAGVDRYIIPGTDWDSSTSAVALSEKFEGVYACVGVHPSDAHLYGERERDVMTNLLQSHDHIVAIGEVGLDYYHSTEHVDRQKEVFIEMIDLARTHNLPLIIHTRDCFDDAYAILKEHAQGMQVVIHCFSGSAEQADAWLRLGFHLSFTGMITYKKNEALRSVVARVPIEKMMLETDGPFLAPEGFRGQTCEPRFVRNVAECVAQVKGMSFDEVDAVTTATAERFFKL